MTKRIACFTAYKAPADDTVGINSGCAPEVIELISQLAEGSWEIDLYCVQENLFELQVTQDKTGIRLIQIPANIETGISPAGKSADNVIETIQKFIAANRVGYDLVYTAQLSSAAVAIALKDHLKIPLVFAWPDREHAARFTGRTDSGSIRKLEQQIVRRADLVIVENQQTKAGLIEAHAANPKKIFVVPGGINSQEFNPENKIAARARLQLEEKRQVLLHVAGQHEFVGVDNIIKALALLDDANRQISLVVIHDQSIPGSLEDDSQQSRLESMAQDLGLAKQVDFVVWNEQLSMADYYAAADILVATPGSKGEGMCTLQAMACGTPVIGSDAPSINLNVLDGKTGFLVPSKAAEVLADRIALILRNEALLDQMRRNSVKHIRENFSWAQVASQMEDLFEYVMLTKGKKTLPTPTKTRGSVNRHNPARGLSLKKNILARYGNS